MKTINIDGVIGWDVTAADIRVEFKAAGGDEIDLVISSPGGSVYEGLAIYNAIKDYRKQGGKVNARIVGLAASMATYVPLAADSITIEDNAIWMIHNPYSVCMGDQNDMNKEAEILSGIAVIMASAYSKKSGKTSEEIRQMMDEETYLFNGEIIENGFADFGTVSENSKNKTAAMATARTSFEAMKVSMSKQPEKLQTDKAAALIAEMNTKTVVNRGKKTAPVRAKKENKMEKKSGSYNEAIEAAEAVGRKQEQDRYNSLQFIARRYSNNAEIVALCAEAIELGTPSNDSMLQSKISLALRSGNVLSDGSREDAEAAHLAGMTLSEYKKFENDGEIII